MSAARLPESGAERDGRRADQVYSADDVARLLGISRATFYTLGYFKSRKVRLSPNRVGYLASDVMLFQARQRGAA